MARQISVEVYKFDELDEQAQAHALEKFRYSSVDYSDWCEFVLDDIDTLAECLGIAIAPRSHNSTDKTIHTRQPEIQYNLDDNYRTFVFEGTYTYSKQWRDKVVHKYGKPQGKLQKFLNEWHRLQVSIQKPAFYQIVSDIKVHYFGGQRMGLWLNTSYADGRGTTREQDNAVRELLELFCDYALDMLDTEYEYRTSDEQVAEHIRINEYEFTEDGELV